ncbi:hypothetical protein Rsub_04494 [Raphidocelis subcapitata]|uniref:Uncharacterized protein n=1 Tax=Raphidocelis subcapitata TaxID=307507 RepID=A0A2V0P4N1_9CHLO|nr:hypothetical protein Rsub_04494 [Raphidocelis subcapitata]|eukprot:GBF92147.1 hypothetical protein Rsub_04494 [Raphidocelis subcapitata]
MTTPVPCSAEEAAAGRLIVSALVQGIIDRLVAPEIAHSVVATAINNIKAQAEEREAAARAAKPVSPAAALLQRAKALIPRRKTASKRAAGRKNPAKKQAAAAAAAPAPLEAPATAADVDATDAAPTPARKPSGAAKLAGKVKAIIEPLKPAPRRTRELPPAPACTDAPTTDDAAVEVCIVTVAAPAALTKKATPKPLPFGERVASAFKSVFTCGTQRHQLPIM